MGHTSGHIPTRGFTGLEDKEEDVAAVMAAVLSLRNNKEGFFRVINTTIDLFYLRMSDFLDVVMPG